MALAIALGSVTVTHWVGMDVGCKRDAIAAFNGYLEYVGHGAFRRVFADAKHRFVYKLATEGCNSNNESEYAAMLALHNNAEMGRYASACAIYYVNGRAILAMQYREDVPSNRTAAFAEFRSRVATHNAKRIEPNIRDMVDHAGNYRATPAGRIKMTDLGGFDW